MPVRPGWHDAYWKGLDRETSKKIRTTCPRCGSASTYYNKQYRVWRCGKCEYSFVVEGFGDRKPWWKRLFGRGS
ncbi:transposase [Chloroflexota bacterium]